MKAFYIAPYGCDNADGTIENPFATIDRARAEVRKADKSEPITVYIRGGEYNITAPVYFTSEDSGTEICPVTYEAYGNEDPVFSGGLRIPKNKVKKAENREIVERVIDPFAASKLMQADLSDLGEDIPNPVDEQRGLRHTPIEVYVNGKALTQSRWPNDEPGHAYLRTRQTWVDLDHWGEKPFTFTYIDRTDHARRFWDKVDVSQLCFCGFMGNDWSDGTYRISSFDFREKKVTSTCGSAYPARGNCRFYFFNLPEEIDVPGESYIDREAKMIYFYPPCDMENAEVILPKYNDVFLSFEDVSNVTFRNISIVYTRPAPIRGRNLKDFTLDGVNIGHTSQAAAGLEGSSITVRNCHFYDTASGMLHVRGGDRKELVPANNRIMNNRLHSMCRNVRTYRPALSVSGMGFDVENNEIYDSPHLIIECANSNDIRFRYNEIHHAVADSSDMGAIYWGRNWSTFGIEICYNYFHHNYNTYGGVGQQSVFVDDGSAGPYMFGNIFYRGSLPESLGGTERDSFAVKENGGQYGVFRNNIFIDSPMALRFQTWKWMFGTDGAYFEWPGQRQGGWWQWAASDGEWKKVTRDVDIFGRKWREHYRGTQWEPIPDLFSEELRREWKSLRTPETSKEYEAFLDAHAPECTNLVEGNVNIGIKTDNNGQTYTGNARGTENFRAQTDILPSGESMFRDYGRDFTLTPQGLDHIRKTLPGFENIHTEKIGLMPYLRNGVSREVGGKAPTAEKLRIKRGGRFRRSEVIRAEYRYFSPEGTDAGPAEFIWEKSEKRNGEYRTIWGKKDAEVVINGAIRGKYVRFGVRVYDKNRLYSEIVYSAPIKI